MSKLSFMATHITGAQRSIENIQLQAACDARGWVTAQTPGMPAQALLPFVFFFVFFFLFFFLLPGARNLHRRSLYSLDSTWPVL